MAEYVAVKLVGGPHDGDNGAVMLPLPEEIWTVACGNPGCDAGGIHWFFPSDSPPVADYERYRQDRQAGDVWLYVFADLETEGDPGLSARSKEPVPA